MAAASHTPPISPPGKCQNFRSSWRTWKGGGSLVAPAITGMRKQRNPSTSVYDARLRASAWATGGAVGPGAGTLVVGTTAMDEVAAAAAVRSAKVFLFRLPGGRPHRRGTGGVAATCSLALPLAPSALKSPTAYMAKAKFGGRGRGGSVE
jgi:hypothetical protein